MIIYSVTVVIKKNVEDVWLEWMRKLHLIDVMQTGYFLNCDLQKLLIPDSPSDESTYIINYSLQSLDLYQEYLVKEAPRLQNEHNEKFSGKFRASRAVYEVLKK